MEPRGESIADKLAVAAGKCGEAEVRAPLPGKPSLRLNILITLGQDQLLQKHDSHVWHQRSRCSLQRLEEDAATLHGPSPQRIEA